MFGPPGRNVGAPQIDPRSAPQCLGEVPRPADITGIFDDFSAIPPQWPFGRVSLDIFVTA
jgi:hypothetical protein